MDPSAVDTARGVGWEDSETEMCSGSEAGLHLRLIDFCITQR